MQIAFEVDGAKVVFTRDWLFGTATVTIDGTKTRLQSPVALGTHFDFALTKRWAVTVAGREVTIEKTRPVLLAGLRPARYVVKLGERVLAERTGY